MKTGFMLGGITCLVALALPIASALSKPDDAVNAHHYTVRVDGADGIKLRMLLVAKPAAMKAPTREAKIVTIPFETTFEASSFFVWFDTLDGGHGGKDGDLIMGTYMVDGELQGGGFGGTIKKENNQSFGLGNL